MKHQVTSVALQHCVTVALITRVFIWSDRNDEVRQRSERARIRGNKTTKSFKRKATKTRSIAHWSVMDVSVSDKGRDWIIRAWPDTRVSCNFCFWCGCRMCKLSLHIIRKFARAAFGRKDKGTLARFIPEKNYWNCAGHFWFCLRVPVHKSRYKVSKQYATANQWLLNKGRTMVIPCEPVHQDRTKFLIAQSYVNRQRAFKSIQKCTQIINLMPHSKARFTSHSVVG